MCNIYKIFRYLSFSEGKHLQLPLEKDKRKILSVHLDIFAGSFIKCTQSSFHLRVSVLLNLSLGNG